MSAPLERRPGPTVRVRATEHRHDGAGPAPARTRDDRVVTEEPLELRLAWPGAAARRAWVTMRTPGDDFALATGWALTAGHLVGPPDRVAYCTDAALTPRQEFNVVTVTLPGPPPVPVPVHHGDHGAGSACGVCGADSIDDAVRVARAVQRWNGPDLDPGLVPALGEQLRVHQQLFDRTGGVHAAGMLGPDGSLVQVREDVGRHNAVDKVVGARVLAGLSPALPALVVSGRAGFELVQKAVVAGVGALVAVGAPTSLSVELAERSGLALYAFTRPGRTVRYA